MAEACDHLAAVRVDAVFDDDTLRSAAAEAMHHGLEKLIELSKAEPRVSSTTETCEMGQSRSTIESTDLDAAKTLVKFALDARKLLGMKKADSKVGGLVDLFDGNGNWDLKDQG